MARIYSRAAHFGSASSASRPSAIYLALILLLILTLGRLLEESGRMKRLMAAAENWIGSRKILAAFFPALIGFLPLPGGALFSAPMVEAACPPDGLTADHKTIINYWFRHIWEYWWPFYPGFVLAAGLLQIAFWRFTLIQFPLALICLFAGWLILIRPIKIHRAPERPGRRVGHFLGLGKPILLLPVLVAAAALALRPGEGGEGISSELALILALAACLSWLAVSEGFFPRRFLGLISPRKHGSMVLLVMSALYFKEVIEETTAATRIGEELISIGLPVLALIVALPFLAGLVTGLGVGFVGISFPVVLPLLAGRGSKPDLLYPSIAFLAGYMGIMLSPIHFCLLFSRDYFRAALSPCYLWLVKLASLTALIAAAYYLLLLAVH